MYDDEDSNEVTYLDGLDLFVELFANNFIDMSIKATFTNGRMLI